MEQIVSLTVQSKDLKGNYFSYHSCDCCAMSEEDEKNTQVLMHLAADVLLDILEKSEKSQ